MTYSDGTPVAVGDPVTGSFPTPFPVSPDGKNPTYPMVQRTGTVVSISNAVVMVEYDFVLLGKPAKRMEWIDPKKLTKKKA